MTTGECVGGVGAWCLVPAAPATVWPHAASSLPWAAAAAAAAAWPSRRHLTPVHAGRACPPSSPPSLPLPAGLKQLIFNVGSTMGQVSGPVAILAVGAEAARTNGAEGLLQFTALVNINLACVNILPLPALDGACVCVSAAPRCARFAAPSLPHSITMGASTVGCGPGGGGSVGWLVGWSVGLPAPPCRARPPATGFGLMLLGVERARGGARIDPDVEDFISSLGTALLILLSIWAVSRDLDALSMYLFRTPAPPPVAPTTTITAADMLPVVTATPFPLPPLPPPLS